MYASCAERCGSGMSRLTLRPTILLLRVSEQSLGGTVEYFDAALVVDDDHRIDRGVEQGLQFFGGL
jgi:hypothetical protein